MDAARAAAVGAGVLLVDEPDGAVAGGGQESESAEALHLVAGDAEELGDVFLRPAATASQLGDTSTHIALESLDADRRHATVRHPYPSSATGL